MNGGVRSKAPGDKFKGGYERPFTVVPVESLEYLSRDVTATFEDIPFWAVEHLFHRIHVEMGRADLDGWEAKLVIQYSGLNETEFERLRSLRDLFWMDFEIDVTETRLYSPEGRDDLVSGKGNPQGE